MEYFIPLHDVCTINIQKPNRQYSGVTKKQGTAEQEPRSPTVPCTELHSYKMVPVPPQSSAKTGVSVRGHNPCDVIKVPESRPQPCCKYSVAETILVVHFQVLNDGLCYVKYFVCFFISTQHFALVWHCSDTTKEAQTGPWRPSNHEVWITTTYYTNQCKTFNLILNTWAYCIFRAVKPLLLTHLILIKCQRGSVLENISEILVILDTADSFRKGKFKRQNMWWLT